MSSATVRLDAVRFCTHCGTQLQPNGKFCSTCGGTTTATAQAGGAPKPSVISIAGSGGDEVAALEQMVAEHPDDPSYQKLLAVQLHDDAMRDWWKDPEDGQLLCTTARQIRYARRQIDRAEALRFDDPQLRAELAKMRQLVESMEKRVYSGSWFHVIVLGFFYIVPGVMWWFVNLRPNFLLNRDYVHQSETGKHPAALAKMGGAMEKVSNACEQIFGGWGFIPTLIVMVLLCPIFMVLAYKQNYMDVKKEYDAS